MIRRIAISIALLLIVLASVHAQAQQGKGSNRVDITPRRVILEPRERAGEFTLLNLGGERSIIHISIINYRQDETGTYTILKEPLNPAFDPEKIVRMSPRQFELQPGGKQVVRFSIRKPADLPEGEYRFHVSAIKIDSFGPNLPVTGKGEQRVALAMNFGAAIPVVVRHGNVTATAIIGNAAYTPSNAEGKPEIRFDITREGNASTIGRILAFWEPQGGEIKPIANSGNMNIFAEVNVRHAVIPLDFAPQGPGVIRIIYMNEETKTPYAETTIQN